VILLHLEPERGLLRSTEAPDRMEMEGQDFHAKVADAYLRIAEEHPERIVVIEADKHPDEVFEDVRRALEKALVDREDGAGAQARSRAETEDDGAIEDGTAAAGDGTEGPPRD
jgi:dTMP kinase